MKFYFENKTVLVTGSSRGIGRVTAKMFADAGATVIVHYNSKSDEAEKTLQMMKPGKHFSIGAALDKNENIQKLAETAINKAGRIDILVNNAGIFDECPVQNTSFEDWVLHWDRAVSINLTAVAHLSYFIGRQMIANGGGRIVNVSSRGAFRGEPNAPAYGASKAGLNGLTQSMAKAFASFNIFVYAVAPGFVETEMAAKALNGPMGEEIRNQSPMGRVAKPEDVAHAILMLASEGSEFMTGTIVDVNGASYLRM
jgi:NAD(P)-dependent dehydrogenase (short-subunit alcohol dehydrogenase family)